MRNNYKLKDCPFCGGRPDIECQSYWYFGVTFNVKCRNCNLIMEVSSFEPSKIEEKVIEKWNNRV